MFSSKTIKRDKIIVVFKINSLELMCHWKLTYSLDSWWTKRHRRHFHFFHSSIIEKFSNHNENFQNKIFNNLQRIFWNSTSVRYGTTILTEVNWMERKKFFRRSLHNRQSTRVDWKVLRCRERLKLEPQTFWGRKIPFISQTHSPKSTGNVPKVENLGSWEIPQAQWSNFNTLPDSRKDRWGNSQYS